MASLTDEQRKGHQAVSEEDLKALENKIQELRSGCDSCQQAPAVCSKHAPEARQLLRDSLLNPAQGRWYMDLPNYATTIGKLFDAGTPLKAIFSAITDFRRKYDQRAYTSLRVDDDEFTKAYKTEAAEMFDQKKPLEKIVAFLQQKEAESQRGKTPKELEFGKLLGACTQDEDRYKLLKEHYTTPQPEDSEDVAALRKKYAALFEQNMPYERIRATMTKDVEERDAEIAKRERMRKEYGRELQNLRMGEAGHKKKQQRKKERQAAGMMKFMKDNSHPCSRKGCEKTAEPTSSTLGPRECRICYALSEDGGKRTYYCSQACEDTSEAAHYEEAHACVAGPECVSKTDSIDRKTGGFCDFCENYFDARSYFCSVACYEKNKDLHDEQIHQERKTALVQKWEDDPQLENEWLANHPEPMVA